jgi:hypothetical protein
MDELNYKKPNNRACKRHSASSKIRVTCHKKGAADCGPKLSAMVLDLSQAGARLLVSVPLQVGDEIVLGLERPSDQRTLTRHGTVVWSFPIRKNGYAVGLRLTEPILGDDLAHVTI